MKIWLLNIEETLLIHHYVIEVIIADKYVIFADGIHLDCEVDLWLIASLIVGDCIIFEDIQFIELVVRAWCYEVLDKEETVCAPCNVHYLVVREGDVRVVHDVDVLFPSIYCQPSKCIVVKNDVVCHSSVACRVLIVFAFAWCLKITQLDVISDV